MGSLFKKPKAQKVPPPTPQELALGRRQDDALSREIEEENRRKKNILRDTLGNRSLLGGISSDGGSGLFSGVSFAGATSIGAGSPGRGSAGSSLLTTGGSASSIGSTSTGGGGKTGSNVRKQRN